jgi:hypothetical protein
MRISFRSFYAFSAFVSNALHLAFIVLVGFNAMGCRDSSQDSPDSSITSQNAASSDNVVTSDNAAEQGSVQRETKPLDLPSSEPAPGVPGQSGVASARSNVSREEFILRISMNAQDYIKRKQNNYQQAYLLVGKSTESGFDSSAIEFVEDYFPSKQYQIRINGIRAIVPRELVNDLHEATIDIEEGSDKLIVRKYR